MRTALITGIGGQDGSYLAELLLKIGYRVVGMVHGPVSAPQPRIEHLRGSIDLIEGDLLNQPALEEMLDRYRPAELYNFAASHPASSQSFRDPVLTGEFNALAVVRLLESVRAVDTSIRFCQASSAQIFARSPVSPQNERTPFCPGNPYGIAKLYGHLITKNYREAHGMFACSSILFNHESPRRGEKFVTRKITLAVARISAGLQDRLYLEDLDARRDWGFAADYVRAMWLMLQASAADDYVLATGEIHSVREFCRIAFEHVGLGYERFVSHDPRGPQASNAVELVGNAEKARRVLSWRPTLSFPELVRMMVDSDIALITSTSTSSARLVSPEPL